jgi:hypothetical protein
VEERKLRGADDRRLPVTEPVKEPGAGLLTTCSLLPFPIHHRNQKLIIFVQVLLAIRAVQHIISGMRMQ